MDQTVEVTHGRNSPQTLAQVDSEQTASGGFSKSVALTFEDKQSTPSSLEPLCSLELAIPLRSWHVVRSAAKKGGFWFHVGCSNSTSSVLEGQFMMKSMLRAGGK